MAEYSERLSQAVATELRAQRARINITIDQLVTRTGLSKSTVHHYLTGKTGHHLHAFVNMCFALETEPAAVLDVAEKQGCAHGR